MEYHLQNCDHVFTFYGSELISPKEGFINFLLHYTDIKPRAKFDFAEMGGEDYELVSNWQCTEYSVMQGVASGIIQE